MRRNCAAWPPLRFTFLQNVLKRDEGVEVCVKLANFRGALQLYSVRLRFFRLSSEGPPLGDGGGYALSCALEGCPGSVDSVATITSQNWSRCHSILFLCVHGLPCIRLGDLGGDVGPRIWAAGQHSQEMDFLKQKDLPQLEWLVCTRFYFRRNWAWSSVSRATYS